MNNAFDSDLMAQRVESVKAGVIGGLCVGLSWAIAHLINIFILVKYFSTNTENLHLLLSGGVAIFCGLLFGVTYRYIIREDENPYLKTGGVMAFGLVRALTQLEMGLNGSQSLLPLVVLGVESVLGFMVAGFVLDVAIGWGWVKAFR